MQNNKQSFTADEPISSVVGGAPVRPQRNRPQPQAGWGEKQDEKKPERKKSGVTRRAPARGRYIDEYARPQI